MEKRVEEALVHLLQRRSQTPTNVIFRGGHVYCVGDLDFWGRNDDGDFEIACYYEKRKFPEPGAAAQDSDFGGRRFYLFYPSDIERVVDEVDDAILYEAETSSFYDDTFKC